MYIGINLLQGIFMHRYNFDYFNHADNFHLTVKSIKMGKHANLNFHDHTFSEIVVVLRAGAARHLCSGKACALRDGDVMIIHPGTVHAYENTGRMELFNLMYEPALLPLPLLDGAALDVFHKITDSEYKSSFPEQPVLCLPPAELARCVDIIRQIEGEVNSDLPGNRLSAFGLFLNLIVHISRCGGSSGAAAMDSSAVPALHFLNLHYREKISIEQLARLCNMSRASFFTHFHKMTGYPPLAYQQEKRLEAAEKLLRTTNRDLGEIADHCGFSDSNYFSKLFTRKFGISPGRFRRQLRQNDQEP